MHGGNQEQNRSEVGSPLSPGGEIVADDIKQPGLEFACDERSALTCSWGLTEIARIALLEQRTEST